MSDDFDDVEVPEEVVRNVSDRPDTSSRKFRQFFDE